MLCTVAACAPLGWTPCASDDVCHLAFGVGTTCGASGLCEEAPVPARCEVLEPPRWLDASPTPEEVFVIGGLSSTVLDQAVDRAYQLAVRQLNDAGGLDGRPLAYARCDYRADAGIDTRTAREAALHGSAWLVEGLGARVLVGPASSELTAAVWLEHGGEVAVISPSATSVALTALEPDEASDETPGTLWRTAPPDSLQGTAIAYDLIAQGAVGVAAVVQAGTYGDGLYEGFELAFTGDGRSARRFSFDDPSELVDATSSAAELSTTDYPWVLFIASDLGDAVSFLNAASVSAGFADRGIYLTDGAADVSLIAQTPGAAGLYGRVRGTKPGRPDGSVYQSFRSAYAAAWGGQDPDGFAWPAHAYDAAWLAAYGLAWSHHQEGHVDARGIGRGLRRISDGASVPLRSSGWASGEAAFRLGDGVDLDGASGALDYDPLTEETSGPVDLWIIDADAGAIVVVGTCLPDGTCAPSVE